jgi:ubiquinone/menaquinone biosynthesis C-methylase UbiE
MGNTPDKLAWRLNDKGPVAYEEYLVPRYFAPWAERLCDLTGVPAGSRVLDIACGTGAVTRAAARRTGGSGSVTGLDLSPAMLDSARRSVDGLPPRFEFQQGDATAMPFSDGSFDVALCQQAMQFMDRQAAVAEMRRVVVPGGRLGFAILRGIDFHPAYGVLADALERYGGPELGGMMRSPFPALDREDLRELARTAGFEDVKVRIEVLEIRYPSPAEFLRQEAASSPCAEQIYLFGEDTRARLVADLEEGLRRFVDDDGLVFPAQTFMVSAR